MNTTPEIRIDPEDFDAEGVILEYRRVIALLETETAPTAKAEYEASARRLQTAWAEWQGEDSLHETVFGGPDV